MKRTWRETCHGNFLNKYHTIPINVIIIFTALKMYSDYYKNNNTFPWAPSYDSLGVLEPLFENPCAEWKWKMKQAIYIHKGIDRQLHLVTLVFVVGSWLVGGGKMSVLIDLLCAFAFSYIYILC